MSLDSFAEEKQCVTLPSSAMRLNLFVLTITSPSIDRPRALLNSAFESDRKTIPASAPPEDCPHAYIIVCCVV